MNVLSLFDGLSGGRIALERTGIEVDNYFASEIDKYAIQIAQHNYPDNIQLGDVTNWREWDLPKIDLLIGGSPCQGFSFAGKQLNFDDPRSKLFFEFVDVLNHVKPKYFMLENVKMKKESEDIITEYLGVEPIEINSALVSAQNRKRLYWTNIPGVTQPKDKGIVLNDIISTDEKVIGAAMRGRYTNNGKTQQFIELRKDEKANCLTTVAKNSLCVMVGHNDLKGFDIIKRVYSTEAKAPTLTTMQGGHREPKIAVNDVEWRKLTPLECERLQTLPEKIIELEVEICEESAKNFVNVVKKNHKKLKHVLNVEKEELKEFVNSVKENMKLNNQQIKFIAEETADTQTQSQIKKCISANKEELNMNVNIAEKKTKFLNPKKEVDSATQNVFINITEGKITHVGKEEYLQKEQKYTRVMNGKSALKMSGKEMTQLVEYVTKNSVTEKDKNFIYITSYLLSQKNIDAMLIIYYLFAKNVIDGYTATKTQKKSISLKFNDGYTACVSNSQRFKAIGNGWTIDVIAHILGGLK